MYFKDMTILAALSIILILVLYIAVYGNFQLTDSRLKEKLTAQILSGMLCSDKGDRWIIYKDQAVKTAEEIADKMIEDRKQ